LEKNIRDCSDMEFRKTAFGENYQTAVTWNFVKQHLEKTIRDCEAILCSREDTFF
jgi:hypothetical protein